MNGEQKQLIHHMMPNGNIHVSYCSFNSFLIVIITFDLSSNL